MAVYDVHAHIYPDAIAPRAAEAVGRFYGDAPIQGTGTVGQLLEQAAESPVTHLVVHSVATTAHSVTSINNFIAATVTERNAQAEAAGNGKRLIGFMAMHQDFPDPEAEIARAVSLGLRGLKLHPDTQGVAVDDPRMMRIFELAEGRLPVIVHTGDFRFDYSNPDRLVNVLRAFPNLTLDAAHFGYWSCCDRGWDGLREQAEHNPNLYVDCSSSLYALGQRHFAELVRLWGADRVMFGSDYPMWHPAEEYRLVSESGLTEGELQALFTRTPERFLGAFRD